MDTDEDETSIAELMDAVLHLHNRDTEVLAIVFQYITVADLKQCRYLSKDLTIPATKLLKAKTFVRFENVSSLQRYIQEASTMQTMWENYSITVSSKLSADLLLQFGIHCGFQVKLLELDVKHRETNLTYLEDVFSEKLPNLEELTIKGKFPTGSIFPNPHRMIGKMEKVQVFNLFAKGWHRLPPLPTGEIIFRSPVIGQLLSAMPNLTKIDYFPDVDTPRDAHRHYSSFVYTLTEIQSLELRKLAEIQHFTLTFLIDTPCLEKFAARNYPLQKLHILVEEEVQSQQLCWFLETYRVTLTDLVIRSATDNSILWPRLIALKNLTLVGVNVRGTDFIASFPELKSLHISQDRVTTVNFAPERSLQVPHTLTCLKIVESVAVNAAFRISDNGLSIVFRDLPFLRELAIVQCVDSNQPTFSDEGITGSKISISTSELSVHPRDLRVLNRNLMRFSHFIGSLADLRKLTLKATNITDVSLLCGVVNCQRLMYLDISSPQISERSCIEMLDYLNVSRLRVQDFGSFTSSGKSEILVRMRFQEVFYG